MADVNLFHYRNKKEEKKEEKEDERMRDEQGDTSNGDEMRVSCVHNFGLWERGPVGEGRRG